MTYQIISTNGTAHYVNGVFEIEFRDNRVIFIGTGNQELAVVNFNNIVIYKPFEKKK